MDNSIRLQYLNALGIDVWVPRRVTVSVDDIAVEDDTCQDASAEHLQELCLNESLPIRDFTYEWSVLEAEVAACDQCNLCQTRTQTVFGTGNKNARWMIIGEAPGQNEDEQGKPFVGKAGALLTEMLRSAGLSREEVFIANILKCRPPGNRDPKPEEVEQCSEFLRRQLALINPEIILAVGRISAQTLLKTDAPIGKLRGKVYALQGVPLVVVYHPSYLLRSLLEKRKAWQDLQLAINTFNENKTKG